MEFFILGVIIYWIIYGVSKSVGESSSSSQNSATNRNHHQAGRQSRNIMSAFEIRALEETRGKNNDIPVIAIEAKGLIPVYSTTQINFIVTASDITTDLDGDRLLCLIPDFQWPDNMGYRSFQKGGSLAPNHGFSDWVEIGVAPTETLVAPKSGKRKLKFTALVVREGSNNTQPIQTFDIVTRADTIISANLREIGYIERDEKRLEAIRLSLHLGIAVAYSDGSLAQSEGKIIRKWVVDQLELLSEDERKKAKTDLNNSIRSACEKAEAGELDYETIASKLNKNCLPGVKIQSLELCVRVMSADGIISSKEMTLIRKLGLILEVSHDNLRKLIDKNPPVTNAKMSTSSINDEELVGLPTGLSRENTLREIRKLFAEYNGRQTNEKDSSKRAHNQRMLDALSRLRVKYGK